jgi:hypothetical protein
MSALTVTNDKTSVTLSDGQTAWTFDRANAWLLVNQLMIVAAALENEGPRRTYHVPTFTSRPAKVVAP